MRSAIRWATQTKTTPTDDFYVSSVKNGSLYEYSQASADRDTIRPRVLEGGKLRFDAWLSYLQPQDFYSQLNLMNLDQIGEPIWSSGNFDLAYATSEDNHRSLNVTIPLGNSTQEEKYYSKMYTHNLTMMLYLQVMATDAYHKDYDPSVAASEQPVTIMRGH
jgi:hypothetical protein